MIVQIDNIESCICSYDAVMICLVRYRNSYTGDSDSENKS